MTRTISVANQRRQARARACPCTCEGRARSMRSPPSSRCVELRRLRQDSVDSDTCRPGSSSRRISRALRSWTGFMCALRSRPQPTRSRGPAVSPPPRAQSPRRSASPPRRVVHPLVHLEPVAATDQRLGWIPEDVVQLLAVRPRISSTSRKPSRRHERRVRSVLRDHGVRRHGRAVEERADARRVNAERTNALDDTEVESRRRRGDFATRDSPVSVTAKTSVNVPPVSHPTIQLTSPPLVDAV